MTRNTHLLSNGFQFETEKRSATKEDAVVIEEDSLRGKLPRLNCYYHGFSSTHANSSAALSLCDGMVS